MNPCEEHIMKMLINKDVAGVFWDADEYYLNDKKQEAGKYLREHKTWKEFKKDGFNWVSLILKKKKKSLYLEFQRNCPSSAFWFFN